LNINLHTTLRNIFILSLIWILIEGVFRKWFFLSLSGALFNVKYVLFFLCYLVFLMGKLPGIRVQYAYQFLILIYVSWCLLGILNNRLDNQMLVGIIGLVTHIFFIPLIHMTQFLFKSRDVIHSFIKILVYTSFPICILGMVQFYLPTDDLLNGFVNQDQLINRVGEFTRISSVFSFVKIYNVYLLFVITLLTSSILYRILRGEKIFIYTISLLLLIVNMFMTGSRLPIILMLFNIIVFGGYILFNFIQLRKTVIIVFSAGIIAIYSLYFTTNLVKDPIDAVIKRSEIAELRHRTDADGFMDIRLRLKDKLDIFKFRNEAGLFGYGIGTSYQGTEGLISNPIPFYFEEEGERLVLELGIVGGVIILLLRFFIFLFSIRLLINCKSHGLKLILFSLSIYLIPHIMALQLTVYNYLDNFIYWFTFGLIIALSKIDKVEFNDQSQE